MQLSSKLAKAYAFLGEGDKCIRTTEDFIMRIFPIAPESFD